MSNLNSDVTNVQAGNACTSNSTKTEPSFTLSPASMKILQHWISYTKLDPPLLEHYIKDLYAIMSLIITHTDEFSINAHEIRSAALQHMAILNYLIRDFKELLENEKSKN